MTAVQLDMDKEGKSPNQAAEAFDVDYYYNFIRPLKILIADSCRQVSNKNILSNIQINRLT